MVLREARYGKPIAELFVWTPPREIYSRLDLGLLSL
jgi:hypothetical protein